MRLLVHSGGQEITVKANLDRMSGTEIVTLRKAATLTNKSPETIRKWCKKHQIGDFRDGRWHVRKADLNRILRARIVLGQR